MFELAHEIHLLNDVFVSPSPSPSSLLKLPNVSGAPNDCKISVRRSRCSGCCLEFSVT